MWFNIGGVLNVWALLLFQINLFIKLYHKDEGIAWAWLHQILIFKPTNMLKHIMKLAYYSQSLVKISPSMNKKCNWCP
jgi:hypothetical protein